MLVRGGGLTTAGPAALNLSLTVATNTSSAKWGLSSIADLNLVSSLSSGGALAISSQGLDVTVSAAGCSQFFKVIKLLAVVKPSRVVSCFDNLWFVWVLRFSSNFQSGRKLLPQTLVWTSISIVV